MRQAQEQEFQSFDQVPLFYRYWASTTTTTPAKAIVLLHRGHEHSGRVTHLVDELDLPDTAFFAWDARGNGRSPGARGDAPGFPALVRDLDSFIAHIGAEHGIAVEDIVVIAQSVGAVVAATWVHDYAPRLRALVMASPAFKVKLYVPFARAGLTLMQKLRGNFFVNSYVKPQWLTHDPARVESYRTDPLISPADLGARAAGPVRGCRPHRGRCAGDQCAGAAAGIRFGFRGAPWPAGPLLRAPVQPDQGTCAPAGLLPRYPRRT